MHAVVCISKQAKSSKSHFGLIVSLWCTGICRSSSPLQTLDAFQGAGDPG